MKKKTLGERLIEMRVAAGIGPAELARRSGVGRTTIHRIETGEQQSASLRTIERLAKTLGREPAELAGHVVQRVPIEQVIQEWLRLEELRPVNRPTDEELAWLRSLPDMVWVGMPPTPDVLGALVEVRRKARATAGK